MSNKLTNRIVWIVVAVILIGGGYFIYAQANKPGPLDAFARCLGEKGAKFYGAFWCPHCQNQKAMFGRSQKLLPYIECSTPDGKGQIKECTDAGIKGYPTWIFADDSQLGGEVALQTLAEKTTCELPKE